jgi:hypothetical protein
MPHPIERLRWVARAEGAGASLLVREAAGALASIGDDLPGLVTGCRRLIDRHPTVGPMWWLGGRVLASGDPVREAYSAANDLDADTTSAALAAHLPDEVTVTILGWPEQAGDALRRRGDLEVLVVDARGEGSTFARRLASSGVEAFEVAESGTGGAVRESGVLLLEATAFGPTGCIATAGSMAAAAVAAGLGVPVWVTAGVGRVLPARLWDALLTRLDDQGDPWELEDELVPIEWLTTVVGPDGPMPAADAAQRADCPVVPELLRWGNPM